jgi:hypothetical protein
MAGWPAPDERAVLTLACCGEQLATRVESHDDEQCIVHLPIHACAEPDTTAADNVLSWFSVDNCWTRPVEIVGFGGYPRSALWMLQANGDAEQWQRRDYVRVSTELPVDAYSGDVRVAEMVAVDVSEGGLRCVASGGDMRTLPSQFNVRFTLDGVEVRLAARVAWSAVGAEDEDEEAVAGFEFQSVPANMQDLVRNYVFRLQIAARRKRLVTH